MLTVRTLKIETAISATKIISATFNRNNDTDANENRSTLTSLRRLPRIDCSDVTLHTNNNTTELIIRCVEPIPSTITLYITDVKRYRYYQPRCTNIS